MTQNDPLSTETPFPHLRSLTSTSLRIPWESWLQEVEASHLPEFKSFATGIQQDKDAVLAGLNLPYSNGPVEGHINRLKLIKRIVS